MKKILPIIMTIIMIPLSACPPPKKCKCPKIIYEVVDTCYFEATLNEQLSVLCKHKKKIINVQYNELHHGALTSYMITYADD